ncbi:MAG: MBL fold metallo-hydrolase [Gemmatimonadota bacterium]|nr:MAG: MBL fold metallo-hydrolase [Gemmatimonadota bacterium]
MSVKILGFPVGPLQANAYLAICEQTGRSALVDPGAEAARLLATAAGEEARIEAILLTHAHIDHIGGVAAAARATGAPIYLHPADATLYAAVPEQALAFGMEIELPPRPDREFQEGQILEIGAAQLEVRHTPGHSPGHVCLIGDGFAVVGDCVFAGSIGRTDLPGGDYRTLLEAIHEKLLTLPDDTVLHPGHGPATTVGRERQANPFLTGAFG